MKTKLISTLVAILCLAGISIHAQESATEKKPNDAEISKILDETNKGEIELAKLAKSKSKNEEVKKFADHMIKEHTTNNKNSMQLAQKLAIKPESNEKSNEMKQEGEKKLTELKSLQGKEFDKAYMDSQVNMHSKVLSDLDNQLLTSAKNPELKAMLEKTRTAVSQHLDQAKKIQSTLQ